MATKPDKPRALALALARVRRKAKGVWRKEAGEGKDARRVPFWPPATHELKERRAIDGWTWWMWWGRCFWTKPNQTACTRTAPHPGNSIGRAPAGRSRYRYVRGYEGMCDDVDLSSVSHLHVAADRPSACLICGGYVAVVVPTFLACNRST
jgi:hypothetical protein